MSENDRAGLSTVGRIPTVQPTTPANDTAAHDELIDQLVRRFGRRLLGKMRPLIGHVLVFGSGFGVNHYANSSDEPTEQRDHAASGPAPEHEDEPQPVPRLLDPKYIDKADICDRDLRLIVDSCSEQAKACGSSNIPRPDNIPDTFEKTQ